MRIFCLITAVVSLANFYSVAPASAARDPVSLVALGRPTRFSATNAPGDQYDPSEQTRANNAGPGFVRVEKGAGNILLKIDDAITSTHFNCTSNFPNLAKSHFVKGDGVYPFDSEMEGIREVMEKSDGEQKFLKVYYNPGVSTTLWEPDAIATFTLTPDAKQILKVQVEQTIISEQEGIEDGTILQPHYTRLPLLESHYTMNCNAQ